MNSIKRLSTALFALLMIRAGSCSRNQAGKNDVEGRVDKLLAEMTLDEKIGQMSQVDPGMLGMEENLKKAVRDGRCGSLLNYWGADRANEIQRIAVKDSRLGIPLLIGRDVIHGYRTVFPIPLGMASSAKQKIV